MLIMGIQETISHLFHYTSLHSAKDKWTISDHFWSFPVPDGPKRMPHSFIIAIKETTHLTLSLPGMISHDFLFQSLTKDIPYSMENLAFDSLLRWKLIELSILTTSLIHLFLNG